MNPMKIGAACLAIATTSLVGVPGAVQAGERPMIVEGVRDVPVAYVSYADLNLNNEWGVDLLNARVRRAATMLCFDNGFQPLKRVASGYICRRQAIAGAEGQIDLAIANAGNARYVAAIRIAVSPR